MSLSTGLSSTDFTVPSPSSRCATSRVCHDVALSSTHIDGQRRAGKMFKTCNSNHQTRKRSSFTQFAFLLMFRILLTQFYIGKSPLTSLPLPMFEFFDLYFSGWAPHWAPMKHGNLKPSAIKKSMSWVLI